MVAFIKVHLVKQAGFVPGDTAPALSETAVRFNDTSWFWTDDNAKAAELFAEPGIYDRDPALADAAIDFVLRMSEGAVIQRRGGPAELRVLETDPARFRVETAFFIIEGDLTLGVVRHSLRFNDGRTVTAAQHTGHTVSFKHEGRAMTLDVESAITGTDVVVGERAVVLSHTSTLVRPGKLFRRPGPMLGTLTYTYTVSADRYGVAIEVTLVPAPGIVLEDVVLSTACDQLSGIPGVQYHALAVRHGSTDTVSRKVARSSARLHVGPADYTAIGQEGASPGFSYAIHCLLEDGAKLSSIEARGQRNGQLHWVLNLYRLGTAADGQPVTVREQRMLTGGGYYDALAHYQDVMARAVGGGHSDPSMTYDIGAELNAVAVHLLFARTGQYAAPPPTARLDELAVWYDRHVQRYFDFIRPDSPDAADRVFTRGIAFVAMSLDCMLRATGDVRYRSMLATAVRLILSLGRRTSRGSDTWDMTFGDTWGGGTPFLDCHTSCLLALARALPHGDAQGAIGRALHEGVLGIRLYTGSVDLGRGHLETYDGLAVVDTPERGHHADTSFWNFKTGLALRALHAVDRATQAGLLSADWRQKQRIRLRLELAHDLLDTSVTWHGEMLEVRTSWWSGETNSETQPWVALGLVPLVDERIEAIPVPDAA